MSVFDLFSKRQKRARGEMPDVYVYDELPLTLRTQVVHIVRDALGVDHYGMEHATNAYQYINDTLCREYGLFELVRHSNSPQESVFNFFLTVDSTERALDVIELCFRIITLIETDSSYQYHTNRQQNTDEALAELNERFREHGVGYQFESGEIIRIDSEFLHTEAVKPVLAVLRNKAFAGANEEFLRAHEHYRHGRQKESLVESLKAFESTMKTVCKLRGWSTQPGDSAKSLIATCMREGLFPTHFESQFASLRSLLESGIPTVRNKYGGHGQGSGPIAVPDYLARYVLHLTATTILFIVDAHGTTK